MDGGSGLDANGSGTDEVLGTSEGRLLESGEAASAEEITQCSVVKEEPAYVRCETR